MRRSNFDLETLIERMMGEVVENTDEPSFGEGQVVLQADGLAHYTWPNDLPPQWTPNGIVTADATGPGCLIESDLSNGIQGLDLLVPERTADPDKRQLAHYRLDNGSPRSWKRLGVVAGDVLGPACFIQNRFDGTFEALVLERNPLSANEHRLVHYWNNKSVSDWQRGLIVSDAATGPAWIIQSRVQDSLTHGNFEVLVQKGSQLVHYWRDNSHPARLWHRGQVITTKATGPGSIIQSHFGAIGNFELVVPEGSTLQHYWHANEGPAGSASERFYFHRSYLPTDKVDDPLPRRDVDFSYGTPYAQYNWELFFHLPILIATRLTRNQRFADARRWFHFVFNPTDDSNELTTHRFWKVLPLRDQERTRIDQLLASLHSKRPEDAARAEEVRRQIKDWMAHPFMPHRIARMRIGAYKKHVVMKYLDNLIAWGDQLFRRDTIESINEAEQLYVMAAGLLGPRPERVPNRTKRVAKTYAELRKAGIDAFSNAVVELENEFPFASDLPPLAGAGEVSGLLGVANTLYFGIPMNDKLLGYWDTVEDRLFKIRHCMNIEGVVRQLPLFEPPIDPALLVQAAAQGISIGSAVAAMNAPLPFYRFTYTLQRALELCNDVKAFGAALLAALEKRDAEALSKLRAEHETQILTLLRTVKEQQKIEAERAMVALVASREAVVSRWQNYQQLLGQQNKPPKLPEVQSAYQDGKYQLTLVDITPAQQSEYKPSGKFELVDLSSIQAGLSISVGPLPAVLNMEAQEGFDQGTKILSYEKEELINSLLATVTSVGSSAIELLGNALNVIPNFSMEFEPFGVGGSISFGGSNLGSAAAAAARVFGILATIFGHNASRAAKQASFVLREREWALQNNLAAREIEQIDRQIVASKVRIDVADKERTNHEEQIKNSQAVEDFLSSKFTNEALYSWMQGEIFALYTQAYQSAFDMAKKAEQCYRFERGITNSGFLNAAGFWDGVHQGLMAGERLHLALKQMEQAYHDQNNREYELTKHVSLVSLDPMQLIKLKETGTCEIELPEALFDFDYPGHYLRRIKSISLTIPCVVGPYVGVNCTLRLLDSTIRYKSTLKGNQYRRDTSQDDDRFFVNHALTTAVATSTAQNDAGMFEVTFHDERYLPFEGAGAVSRWKLELNVAFPQFDYETLTDVVLHIRYTAREGGDRLRNAVNEELKGILKSAEGLLRTEPDGSLPQRSPKLPLSRLFSLRHEFPNEWQKLTSAPAASETDPVDRLVELPIVKTRFPFFLGGASLQPTLVTAVAVAKAHGTLQDFGLALKMDKNDPKAIQLDLKTNSFGNALVADTGQARLSKIETDPTKTWSLALTLSKTRVQALSENLQDLFFVVNYTAEFKN